MSGSNVYQESLEILQSPRHPKLITVLVEAIGCPSIFMVTLPSIRAEMVSLNLKLLWGSIIRQDVLRLFIRYSLYNFALTAVKYNQTKEDYEKYSDSSSG